MSSFSYHIIPADPAERLGKIQVMVLDGSAKAGEIVKNVFSQLGFSKIFIARDGFEGVQMLKDVRIDMIFTDGELRVHRAPVEDAGSDIMGQVDILPVSGIHLSNGCGSPPIPPNPFVPVVMMLNNATSEQVLLARDAGVNELIVKPLGAIEFCEKIALLIDHPRIFITSETYRGPCRRFHSIALTAGAAERRKKEIRVVKWDKTKLSKRKS